MNWIVLSVFVPCLVAGQHNSHTERVAECIHGLQYKSHDGNWVKVKGEIAKHALLHNREDIWGESCMFFKLLFNFAYHQAKLLYGNDYKGIKKLYFDDGAEFVWQVAQLLKSEPPEPSVGHPASNRMVEIQITDVEILYFYQQSWSNKMTMAGFIEASWEDRRLSWDPANQLENYIKVEHMKQVKFIKVQPQDIWTPDFSYEELTEHVSENHFYRQAFVYKNGTVSMHLGIYAGGNCEMDYANFPNDKHECCIHIESKKHPMLLDYNVKVNTIKFPKKGYFPAWWKRISSSVSKDSDGPDDQYKHPSVKMCLTVQRYSTIYIYKIVLPIAAATFIAVVIPLFSGWKLQIGAKLLATVLVYLSVQWTSGYHAAFGPKVPKFVQVYDFLIWTTVVSVTFTIILWGLTFQKRFTPPPNVLSLIANVVNPIFCWTNPGGENYVSFGGMEDGQAEEPAKNIKDYTKDWTTVFLAINNILLALFTVIYFIGLIVCAA